MRAMAVKRIKDGMAVRIRKHVFNYLPHGKFSIKTLIHDSSKIDGYRIFSSIMAKKERTAVKNQKNRSKKGATHEKSTILI